MFTPLDSHDLSSLSETSSSAFSRNDLLELDEFEAEDYRNCTDMDALYLSFETQEPPCPIVELPNEKFKDNKHPNSSRLEPEKFCACDVNRHSEDGETSDPDTIEQTSPVEEAVDPPRSHSVTKGPSTGEKRWLAFARRRVASFQDDTTELISQAEERSHLPELDLASLSPYCLAETANKDEKSQGAVESALPDMLVTLTTMEMGISAKRDDPAEHPAMLLKTQSQFGAEDCWNYDSIHDSAIFDKAQLIEEALDTADIKMDGGSDGGVSANALPSVMVQEQYSDELRSISKNYGSSSSSVAQICPALPSYRMETVHQEPELIRAHSAPTEVKGIGVMEEDVEISSIMGGTVYFNPYHSSDPRMMSSLSEPFEEVIQTSQTGCKKCLSTWVQKKIHFVSFDTESDAASVTRSEYIMDMKRGKERRDFEEHCCHRSRPSSHAGFTNGFVIGPSVSPVPRGGIQDFSRDDAIALNAVLRNDPQLTNVPMGEWTR